MKKTFKKIALVLAAIASAVLILGSACGIYLIYGPTEQLRDLWITTAMSTFTHQYLATWFFSEEYIEKVMDRNKAIEPDEDIDLSLINIGGTETQSESETEPGSDTAGTAASETQTSAATESEQQSESESETSSVPLITIEDVSRGSFVGYMMIVSDPTLVRVGVTNQLESKGQKLNAMCESYGAIAGINAAGFQDVDGIGTGGYPEGIVMTEGKVVWNSTPGTTHSVIGLTYDGKLILGKYTEAELKDSGIRDCVEFTPFLIVNGEAAKVGTTGVHPRSAIGQKADGSMLLLCIDGRSTASIGATQKDVIEIMQEYGAVNCANLDGGSSSTMIYNGELINKPSAASDMRYLATAFLVLDPSKEG